MNQDIAKGKWKEIKGEIRNVWGYITGDELEQAKGNLGAIAGVIQQKYGHKRDDVMKKLNDIMARFEDRIENRENEKKNFENTQSI